METVPAVQGVESVGATYGLSEAATSAERDEVDPLKVSEIPPEAYELAEV